MSKQTQTGMFGEDTSYKLAPGYRVDSLLSTEEALRRFRAGVDSVGELAGGAPSLDSLVRRFVRDVERADTSDLRALHLTRAEYSWLVYPESPLAHPPYRQPPELAWMLLREGSVKGLTRLMRRRAGRPLGLVRWECERTPAREGRNTIWKACVVSTRDAGDAASDGVRGERLFGAVVARDGIYKISSYANQY